MHSHDKDSITYHIDVLNGLQDACIVVEGKCDEAVLRELGVNAHFYHVSGSGQPIFKLAETLAQYKEVVILTDFDKKGSVLASKIVEALHDMHKKIKINLQIRRNMMNCMKNEKVGEVQDLKSLVRRQKIKGG